MIQNIAQLSINKERTKLLEILDFGLEETRSAKVLESQLKRDGDALLIQDKTFDLGKFKQIIVIAMGKAAGDACKFLETIISDKITKGYCIDVTDKDLQFIEHTTGTHPYPSEKNAAFSNAVVSLVSNLSEDDMVIAIISGGGSSLFCMPFDTECAAGTEIFKRLTSDGAPIEEVNTVRKHLSTVKGGGLAKIAYPATIVSMIFSDVPGDDIGLVASGPTVKDSSTIEDAKNILNKYEIRYEGNFFETPKEDKYFEKVFNFLVCSGKNTLLKMSEKAKELGIQSRIFKSDFQADADEAGKILLENTTPGELLLASGETTVKVRGEGKGGRNQHTVLASLEYLKKGDILISCASDGYDYTDAAGAIGDWDTIEKSQNLHLSVPEYLNNNDSFHFFEKTQDHIQTGRTGINVSDIFLVYKK